MRVYLVHHGDSVTPDVDVQRPLSARGREDVTRLAAEAHQRSATPDVIWHSGKLRARQTAEAFWRACNPLAEFSAVRGLQPGDPATWMRDRLTGEPRDIMCVGHLPNLARLLALLLLGDEAAAATLPLHGMVAIGSEPHGPPLWREHWRLDPRELP